VPVHKHTPTGPATELAGGKKTGPFPAKAGIGLRFQHHKAVAVTRPDITWLEVHTESYMGGGQPIAYLEGIRLPSPRLIRSSLPPRGFSGVQIEPKMVQNPDFPVVLRCAARQSRRTAKSGIKKNQWVSISMRNRRRAKTGGFAGFSLRARARGAKTLAVAQK
jgi:hypothetical protein